MALNDEQRAKHAEYMRKFRAIPENAEKHRKEARAYYESHKKRAYLYNREYDKKNPEKVRSWKLKYNHSENGKQVKYLGVLKRRAGLRNVEKSANVDTFIGEMMKDKLCPYCLKPMQRKSVDHLIPLINGGSHTESNVVVCCLSCNQRKSDMSLLEFVVRGEYW
jgi:5-methylcytosine-specific restriction endonuclease McrA